MRPLSREYEARVTRRPRIPLWAAVVIPAAAYAVRSIGRGSFRPDLPDDAVVLAALLGLLVLSSVAGTAAQHRRDDLADQVHDGHDRQSCERQPDEVDSEVELTGSRSPGTADDRQPSSECDT